MQACALARQARAGRQRRATAATVPNRAAAALAATLDTRGTVLRQLRQHIGWQGGQGGFQQQLAHVLRQAVFFGGLRGRLWVGWSGLLFGGQFGWRFLRLFRLFRWRFLLGRSGHLGGTWRQAQTGCAAQVVVFNRIAVTQRCQHTGQAHTGQGTPQTGDAHGLRHLGDGLYLLIIQAQCAQTLQHRLALFFGLAVGATEHPNQP